jgi:hypothetical protein
MTPHELAEPSKEAGRSKDLFLWFSSSIGGLRPAFTFPPKTALAAAREAGVCIWRRPEDDSGQDGSA